MAAVLGWGTARGVWWGMTAGGRREIKSAGWDCGPQVGNPVLNPEGDVTAQLVQALTAR